jgi:hypothetical protein
MNIRDTDREAAANAVAPRVSLNNIESAIAARFDLTADKAIGEHTVAKPVALALLSLCILVMDNGFTVVGKSAPASSANFDAELGKKFAYEDAIRQLWPLMGYALREKLWEGEA